MREIKYRAWVELSNGCSRDDPAYFTEEIMCDVEHLGFDEEGIRDVTIIDDVMSDSASVDFDIEDVVLMQFTGLKDRDGREIYEGDIIKLDRTDCNEIGIKLHVDKVRRSETGGYHVDDKCLYKCRLKKCEVIGNIYENPELLNQELEDVED